MPQASSIVIKNGAATPVDVTFSPESVTPAISVFTDRLGSVYSQFRTLVLRNKFAQKSGVVNKSEMVIEVPIVRIVAGVDKVVGYNRARVEYTFFKDATAAERADIHAFTSNALAHASVRASMRDYDPQY